MTTLGQLIDASQLIEPPAPATAQLQVAGLEYDSRRVEPGFLFFAFPGAKMDGRKFAEDAIAKGAVAVISESPAPDGFSGTWVQVQHGRQTLALAAREFYGRLDEKLVLTGITGTNGKTTTSYLVDSLLTSSGKITAVIGTIEYHLAGKVLPAANTTPESLDLMRLFAQLRQEGGSHVTMEVSSHALALGRVYGLDFHTSIFTNLTRDHLDFHKTMEDYFAAKQMLFEGAGGKPPQAAVVNRDDEWGGRMRFHPKTQVYWYGLGSNANVRAKNISSGFNGLKFDIQHGTERFPVESPLIGKINVYNILAAASAGLSLGLTAEEISRGIKNCLAVPGRFERVDEGQPFVVAVDYAHTDDALRNTLSVARALGPKRIITLFGCGGDRDRTKRPLMGQAAGELSDFVVVTSDNPRSEDPLAIINDALVGVRRTEVKHVVEPDRTAAIDRAIHEAHAGDIVILAGKGHETYQVLKDQTIHFDDREVARQVLRAFGYSREQA